MYNNFLHMTPKKLAHVKNTLDVRGTIVMLKGIIRILGLRGSWNWACRKMAEGHIVRRRSDTGTVRYKLDKEIQRRILWSFPYRDDPRGANAGWESANIFLSDFESTDYECV